MEKLPSNDLSLERIMQLVGLHNHAKLLVLMKERGIKDSVQSIEDYFQEKSQLQSHHLETMVIIAEHTSYTFEKSFPDFLKKTTRNGVIGISQENFTKFLAYFIAPSPIAQDILFTLLVKNGQLNDDELYENFTKRGTFYALQVASTFSHENTKKHHAALSDLIKDIDTQTLSEGLCRHLLEQNSARNTLPEEVRHRFARKIFLTEKHIRFYAERILACENLQTWLKNEAITFPHEVKRFIEYIAKETTIFLAQDVLLLLSSKDEFEQREYLETLVGKLFRECLHEKNARKIREYITFSEKPENLTHHQDHWQDILFTLLRVDDLKTFSLVLHRIAIPQHILEDLCSRRFLSPASWSHFQYLLKKYEDFLFKTLHFSELQTFLTQSSRHHAITRQEAQKLLEYLEAYRLTFTAEEFLKLLPQEHHPENRALIHKKSQEELHRRNMRKSEHPWQGKKQNPALFCAEFYLKEHLFHDIFYVKNLLIQEGITLPFSLRFSLEERATSANLSKDREAILVHLSEIIADELQECSKEAVLVTHLARIHSGDFFTTMTTEEQTVFFLQAKEYFENDDFWPHGMGGRVWATIAQAAIRLSVAEKNFSPEIDLIFDIEHNTGLVLEKSSTVFTQVDHRLLRDLLKKKRYIEGSSQELLVYYRSLFTNIHAQEEDAFFAKAASRIDLWKDCLLRIENYLHLVYPHRKNLLQEIRKLYKKYT